MQTSKQGDHMWYSIDLKDKNEQDLSQVDLIKWEWARKSWRTGEGIKIPHYVHWNKEKWGNWIQRQAGYRREDG